MDKTIKFFRTANAIWLVLYLLAILGLKLAGDRVAIHILIIQTYTAGVLFLSLYVMHARHKGIASILSHLIFICMLGQGLMMLFTLKSVFTLYGVLSLILTGFFTFYLFGFRAFLLSSNAAKYFGVNNNSIVDAKNTQHN